MEVPVWFRGMTRPLSVLESVHGGACRTLPVGCRDAVPDVRKPNSGQRAPKHVGYWAFGRDAVSEAAHATEEVFGVAKRKIADPAGPAIFHYTMAIRPPPGLFPVETD